MCGPNQMEQRLGCGHSEEKEATHSRNKYNCASEKGKLRMRRRRKMSENKKLTVRKKQSENIKLIMKKVKTESENLNKTE